MTTILRFSLRSRPCSNPSLTILTFKVRGQLCIYSFNIASHSQSSTQAIVLIYTGWLWSSTFARGGLRYVEVLSLLNIHVGSGWRPMRRGDDRMLGSGMRLTAMRLPAMTSETRRPLELLFAAFDSTLVRPLSSVYYSFDAG